MRQSQAADQSLSFASVSSARLKQGFVWGLGATLAMTIFMLAGSMAGISPIPKPVPPTLFGAVFGAIVPSALITPLGMVSHFVYGGVWAALLAAWSKPVTVAKGIGLGAFLWLLMQVTVLPIVGWGLFGTAITVRIAGATLVLHVIYGVTVGVIGDR